MTFGRTPQENRPLTVTAVISWTTETASMMTDKESLQDDKHELIESWRKGLSFQEPQATNKQRTYLKNKHNRLAYQKRAQTTPSRLQNERKKYKREDGKSIHFLTTKKGADSESIQKQEDEESFRTADNILERLESISKHYQGQREAIRQDYSSQRESRATSGTSAFVDSPQLLYSDFDPQGSEKMISTSNQDLSYRSMDDISLQTQTNGDKLERSASRNTKRPKIPSSSLSRRESFASKKSSRRTSMQSSVFLRTPQESSTAIHSPAFDAEPNNTILAKAFDTVINCRTISSNDRPIRNLYREENTPTRFPLQLEGCARFNRRNARLREYIQSGLEQDGHRAMAHYYRRQEELSATPSTTTSRAESYRSEQPSATANMGFLKKLVEVDYNS